MRVAFKYLTVLAWPLLALAAACDDDDTTPVGPGTGLQGTLAIYLADAPAAFDQFNLTITRVEARRNDQWVTLSQQPVSLDLLQLTGGESELLAEAEIDTGFYDAVRISIGQATVVTADTQSYQLTVPGNAAMVENQDGFMVEEDQTTQVVVDFDVARSVQAQEGADNYDFDPTLRLVTADSVGKVSGELPDAPRGAVVYAVSGADTVTSTFVGEDGGFTLGFLPPGPFTILVRDTTGTVVGQVEADVTEDEETMVEIELDGVPGDTTGVPGDTTGVPGDTTGVPGDTTSVPGDTTGGPYDTTAAGLLRRF